MIIYMGSPINGHQLFRSMGSPPLFPYLSMMAFPLFEVCGGGHTDFSLPRRLRGGGGACVRVSGWGFMSR